MQISNYQVVKTVYTGSRTLVYRAIHIHNELPVVIKLLKNEYPSFSELVQFRNQYTIAKNINSPLIIQTYNLEPYQNGYALVMEDFGGISLKEWAGSESSQTGVGASRQSLQDFLEVAIAISQALDLLYQERIIHKDIKPANILINPETKQVKLIDFSIASLLPRETQEIKNANALEGTLAYISPEQTGRMNRGIDYRTDFYSLGVTFYELLTGKLPFIASDPMELIHAHIAKLAPLVHEINPEIPLILSQIVQKLMAKNAEDRYQSALGLKFDLQKCLTQLQETGEMPGFVIGERDVSDRFIIPDKLYGRETEVETLLKAFDRVSAGATEMMLVSGFSGIGKTAVVNEVHKPIVRQRGYFIKGKFDQFNRNIPLSAFVQALRDLMGQLLSESDAQLQAWIAKILSAVGDNGQVLIEVIPELELIIGQQPPVTELSGSAAQNRFNLLFQKFIEVFTTADHPLVVFLDDLQWADSASLQLIKLLMSDNGYLLMLGAYRDNEVSSIHPFILTVEEIKKAKAIVNTITLTPLDLADTNHLVADTLNCSRELAQPLTELIDRKTQGNPFFTTQFLKALYKENCITFNLVGEASQNENHRYWECDIAKVNALALTDDVVEFMALQLQKLPAATQHLLKLAACIGNQFDLATLAIVSEQSLIYVATALWKALHEGLILPTSQVYKFFQDAEQSNLQNSVYPTYRFLHDRIQQAAYSLIPDEQKQATHYQIGQLLLANTSLNDREEQLFDIVNHLNIGQSLITEPSQCNELAQLNLAAGCKAKAATAYVAALEYAITGIKLLSPNSWCDHYHLTLQLHQLAAESAYLTGDLSQMTNWIEIAIQHSDSILDQIEVIKIKIQSYAAQKQYMEAIALALDTLAQLGVHLPKSPTSEEIQQQFRDVQDAVSKLTLDELLNRPMMSDRYKLAASQILANMSGITIIALPPLLPITVLSQVKLSIEYGNSPFSAHGYVMYGILVNLFIKDSQTNYQFGQLALELIERSPASFINTKVFQLVGGYTIHGSHHLRKTLPFFDRAYISGLEEGDLEFWGYSTMTKCQYLYFLGSELTELDRVMTVYNDSLAKFQQEACLSWNQIFQQAVKNLIFPSSNLCSLSGDLLKEEEFINQHISANDRLGLHYFYIHKLILCNLFEEYAQGLENSQQAELYLDGADGFINIPIFYFYDSLVHLQNIKLVEDSQRIKFIEKINLNQQKIRVCADQAPMNFQHKFDLVEAEKHQVLGNNYEAGDLYDRAISGAKANDFIQEEALANELAAKFYLNWGKEKVAASYMQEAYYCYARWGAKAKVHDLETGYPQLLEPILRQAKINFNPLETLIDITHTLGQTSTSSTSITDTLDFVSVLKAAQTISSEINLDELLRQLTQIILQNSGADRCVLVLPENEVWQVRAISTLKSTELCCTPLDNHAHVPFKLLQYVKRIQSVVVVNNLQTDLPVIDDYLNQHQPKSILGLPILNQGNLEGIIYLENQATAGAFTNDRLIVINFLGTQAAISIKNAQLYQQSQIYAQQLQQSQLQIVQSEKMSALGNLVSGVAHEINNPVGFLNGNIQPALDYIQDLFGLVDLYQQQYPRPNPDIQAEIETIELEYIREDLPRLVGSMQEGVKRIQDISNSLRTFSRADTDYPVACNIHDGIDSTIMILKHRLKANESRPEIQIIRNYDNLPQVECYAGQINQVFMNILANAIDAIDESNQDRTFADIKANPNCITITTSVENNRVKVAIADNGKGMSEEVKARVFDHLFTTKEVGKGTGLGLAIAKQIINEKHGGSIEVNSVLGQGTEFSILLPITRLT